MTQKKYKQAVLLGATVNLIDCCEYIVRQLRESDKDGYTDELEWRYKRVAELMGVRNDTWDWRQLRNPRYII